MGDNRRARPGPLGRGIGGLVGAVGMPVYRAAIGWRNRRFDAGVGVTRLDRPVISVGNLSVGGTGKTPMVAKVVGELVRAGKTPCIAMRGYKKEANPSGTSDEAEEYARLVPGVPVVAQADRLAGLHALFGSPAGARVDCVVLDDGFQHRWIARDVDIVLIDASAGALEDRLLPAGWLREPMASLARAHAVVVTHAERAAPGEVERILECARRVNPALVPAVCRHAWTAVLTQEGGEEPVEWLRGKRVLAVCAIGNPDAFVRAVQDHGAEVVGKMAFGDHAAFRPAAVACINEGVRRFQPELLVCTQKDWVKLEADAGSLDVPSVRPRLELAFDRGWEELWDLVARAAGVGGGPRMSPTLMPGPGNVASV